LTVAADPDDASNKCLVVHREVKSWNGPVVDMVKAVPGAQYEISVKVKCADKVNISAQKKTTADADEGYDTLKSDTTVSKWTTLTEKFTAPDNFYSYGVYLQTSSGTSDIYVDDISIKLLKVSTPDKSIASLAETYKDVFDIWGVGAGMESLVGEDGLEFIKAQFNAYTPGNEFKPDAILGSSFESLDVDEAEKEGYVIPDAYKTDDANKKSGKVVVPKMDFTNVDSILKTASENNIKVRFHVLVWHQQTPIYFFKQTYKTAKTAANVSEETMNARLEMYIRTVMEHILNSNYADSIYGWDVVNEYLHSHGASDQNVNTNGVTFWEDIYNTANDSSVSGYKSQSGMSLTPSYVKLAFQIAKDELNKHNNTTKLFYNDYNTYDVAEDIVHLIDYINSDGKICDGIGMQSHLDQAYPSAQKFANTIAFFTANMPDEEIQITELDITKELVGGEPKTTDKEQAALYSDIMQAVLVNKKAGANISAFVLWSLYDGVSWRSAKEPCVFSGLFSAKAAFYAMIDAKAKYWN
jgi:endo-1,4-beta-xylanase